MKIIDIDNNILENPDTEAGYLVEDLLFVKHHEATEAVEEQGHYELIAEYPNGGKEYDWIVDVEAVEAKEAWDEYEPVLRYIVYTAEQLAEKLKPTIDKRIENIELDTADIKAVIGGLETMLTQIYNALIQK